MRARKEWIELKQLLERTRRINKIIQKSAGHPISFAEMAATLSKTIESNVYILGKKGKVLGYSFMDGFECGIMADIVKNDTHFPSGYNEDLLSRSESTINLIRGKTCSFNPELSCGQENMFVSVIPIVGGGQRLGTLVLAKVNEFDYSDLILAEYGVTVIGMEILRSKVEKVEEVARQKAVISIAFDSLSYSELEAVEHIFEELDDTHGLLVASKIADKVGITRSVIVNALRKLESAGVIEVRSLGMKGTYIRVLNDHLLEELDRLKGMHKR